MIVPAKYNLRKVAAPVLALVLFGFAIFLLHKLLKPYHVNDIRSAFHSIATYKILLCLCFSALSYFVLTLYDTLAFRYISKPLAYGKIALTSFISYTFANNTGSLSILTSSTIRYRFYSGWGFSGIEIARIIGFCMVSFWLGYLFLTGTSFLASPPAHILSLPVTQSAVLRCIGFLFLLLVGGYVTFSMMRKTSLKFMRWELAMPPTRLALAQIAVAAMDLLAVSGALYVLLPEMSLPFTAFISLFLLAMMLGLLSNVPGGLGVFESIMLLVLTPYASGNHVISALLMFRGIYYLLPLSVAITALGGLEIHSRRAEIAKVSSTLQKTISAMTPQVLALGTFFAGGILLFSGTMPGVYTRLSWLKQVLPLPVLELSHFMGSMAGMGLLILASGLRRRLDMAYFLTVILLVAGSVFSLLKGLDYEEATWLAILLLVLLASRKEFYRRASFFAEPVKPAWFAAVFIVLFGSIWLGFFAYRHQSYTHELWWQFALHGDAPRFMRASVGAVVVICFFTMARLFKPYQPGFALPDKKGLELARVIAVNASDTGAYLALLGDKSLLFSESKKSFLMYGIKGRSWIAMGDPVGDEQETVELIWQFKNLAEDFDGWPVFYEVGPENLSRYIDLGMTVLKIGEEGRVNLAEFSLTGSRRKSIRYIHNRFSKEGYIFEVIPPEEVSLIMSELKIVSDDWLNSKHAGEKGFSLGFFNEEYLRSFPVAVVRFKGRIFAFANFWPGGGKKELSIDLMRYCNDAPHGIMDFIFIEIMLWGKSQGYQWFSLGMVPLAGLEPEKAASLWSNIGTFVYRHGEHFYNFKGLRSYKGKFDPLWQPRYIASPGVLQLPTIFANLTALIGGSLKEVFIRQPHG
ncbi:MAG: bifunctional lysylphosphatidylglycerol flippase/synthetase MprF [Desulfobulbaceae bacterium]|nr:bifunctional lysylphosphatidylglycerol flippase/synthetase MprF [Desulfobulbaceae bacterium]